MSGHFLRASLPFLTAGVLLQSAGAHAESFEVVNYAAPRGWPVQRLDDGRAYVRPDGNGRISLHIGRMDASIAHLAFTVKWRELVETVVPVFAPQPQVQREGDFSIAGGTQRTTFNGQAVAVTLVTITGGGRTVGIVGIAAHDEALREIRAFFDTVVLTPAAPADKGWRPPVSDASRLVGRWWKDAGGRNYFWYEFTDQGLFSYESPREDFQGTFRVQGSQITFTTSTGVTTTRSFSFECVGGKVRLEISGGAGYWSVDKSC